jgi:flagellar motor switch protein FliN
MSDPKDVLAQLLSPAQAEVLDSVGRAAWRSIAATLESLAGDAPTAAEVDGRLVMPDEIVDEYGDAHLVLPLQIATDRDQTATAYAIANTAIMAMYFDTMADDPAAQEQQTMLIAGTLLDQVAQALNREVLSRSTSGLRLTLGAIAANAMPGLLGAMDEPALALTATLSAGRILPFSLVLPGTFLDIVAGAMPAGGVEEAPSAAAAEPEAVPAAPPVPSASSVSAIDPSLGFTLTMDDLDAAEVVDEMPAPQRLRPQPVAEQPVFQAVQEPQPGFASGPAPAGPAFRQPTPISQGPAAHRARFAPLPDAETPAMRSGMDLLAGLQMHVCVELGRTELTVAEVLGLGPGSVIELDRLAGEPVDIMVNDRLVARGEVVVVDENFGVRIVEVVLRNADREEATI